MRIEELTEETKLIRGDLLLVSAPSLPTGVAAYTVKEIKQLGGVREVILDKRKNTYFNLDMYLAQESWAKDIRVVSTNWKHKTAETRIDALAKAVRG